MTPQRAELIRSPIFHTPANPFTADGGPSFVCYEDGGLLVADGRVVACGDYADVRAAHPDVVTTDWRGGFVVPGFVDAHLHFPQLRLAGAMGHSLLDWLELLALPEEARMRDSHYAAETARGFVRALASHGTTTALVFGAHFAPATAQLFDAARLAGLRVCSGLVVSDRHLRADLHITPQQAYRDSRTLIEQYHGHGHLRYAVTPRFALSVSEAMLEVCQQLMTEYPDVTLQTHINESRAEVERASGLFPWASDYLAIYERYGLSGARSVMAHNVQATDSELERLAAAGTAIAHCPASNAALGSGVFPLRRHVKAGIACALGTDVGAGTGFGMLKEGWQAYEMQRLAADPEPLDAGRLLYLATAAGAKALGLSNTIGDFSPGKDADLVYLRPPEGSVLETVVRGAGSATQVLSSLFMMAGAESVREVRVAGAVVHRTTAISD